MATHAIWDGSKYLIVCGDGVKIFRPFIPSGEVWLKGKRQDKPFHLSAGDAVEFHPLVSVGELTWELQILHQGLSVVARVRHEWPGQYVLAEELPASGEINLEQYVTWESCHGKGRMWDEKKLKADLEQLKVVHGIRAGCWSEIMSVEGVAAVTVAEATLPVPPEHARIEDLVGKLREISNPGEGRVDYFASRVQLVDEGMVLARKIPGKPGVPGKDVFGKILPAAGFKDFQFRLKKNVYLSDNGLEVIAACGGQPVRLDERTYMVENIYVLNQDVDLATGSIKFPGDVFVNGNVQDGLYIIAGGKLEIRGSVSHAEIRAEKGAKIRQNLVGGKVVIGERFVVRSKLLYHMSELRDQLNICLQMTEELIKSPGAENYKPGQCLKLIIEKHFPELPKLSASVEKFILEHQDDELISQGLIVSIRTAKHFLAGLGPLDLQSVPFLLRVDEALKQFIEKVVLEIPEKLSFEVNYVQGAIVECGGSFECPIGVYNSNIRVEGDVTIAGVCRGGKIYVGGQVSIGELGGSGVSSTFVQISPNSRLSVKYCHSNVIIVVGKEIIQIEEAYRQLKVYREKGIVQVEKIRVNPF